MRAGRSPAARTFPSLALVSDLSVCKGSAMGDADKDIPYKLAYEEAVRALSQQQGIIDSFRTRAGLLLSTAAITTSFLGAQALDNGGSGLATWFALASFTGAAVVSLGILWPRRLGIHSESEGRNSKLHRGRGAGAD
jgi:hypothetical protein